MNDSTYQRRIAALRKSLSAGEALLVSAAPTLIRNRDSSYPYRPESHLLYLLGDHPADIHLLVTGGTGGSATLFARRRTKQELVWEGPLRGVRQLARRRGAAFVEHDVPLVAIKERLRSVQHLYLHVVPGTVAASLAQQITHAPANDRRLLPHTITHADRLLTPLRERKDSSEVATISDAVRVTAAGLQAAAQHLAPGVTEQELRAVVERTFLAFGAPPSFSTIVATGAHGAVLHHEPTDRKLAQGDLVLIDCGAEWHGYAGDLTRVFPVAGTMTPQQKIIVDGVCRAQAAAIDALRPGVPFSAATKAAREEIIETLVALRVLRGRTASLLKTDADRPYFPHGIGHPLGLDVHDVGDFRGVPHAPVTASMVFTIEPGIYLPKGARGLAPCGVRIEDDVVVTPRGAKILGTPFPKWSGEVEQLLAEVRRR